MPFSSIGGDPSLWMIKAKAAGPGLPRAAPSIFTFQAMGRVIVIRGPGSYTGLRVGLMSAKAFAYATGCALLAVDGFQAIARQSPRDMIDVIADAQRDLVYHQRYKRSPTGDEMLPATALQIV